VGRGGGGGGRSDPLVTVYRGMTGHEGDRFLVTRDRSIAAHHGIVVSAKVRLSKLKSGPEELGWHNQRVPKGQVGHIEAWVNKGDLQWED
jgi:hypothetical protein